MAFFAALIGVAIVLDIYFEKNPVEFNQMETKSEKAAVEHGTIYLFTQGNSFSAKTSVQKTHHRKFFQQSHAKFLQKYHQLRNYQVLKADAKSEMVPVVLSYHYIVFRSYYYSLPDDEPFIS